MGLAPFCQGWPVAAIATGDISNHWQEVHIAAIDTDFAPASDRVWVTLTLM
jgi:hypothetical protein